ncbi:MAG: ARMT1-like domain-containing protein [Dehalococcoidales bacterium]|nr:ARMT1-like domain-containing protein [Dehalococcoidales bacterium]
MKTYLDCLPCLVNQSLKAVRLITSDEDLQRKVLNAMAARIPELSLGLKPLEIARQGYRIITVLPQCSLELQRYYHSADLIISKGQGNYESLEGETGNLFFFLKAKCNLAAGTLGVKVGNAVLKQHRKELRYSGQTSQS